MCTTTTRRHDFPARPLRRRTPFRCVRGYKNEGMATFCIVFVSPGCVVRRWRAGWRARRAWGWACAHRVGRTLSQQSRAARRVAPACAPASPPPQPPPPQGPPAACAPRPRPPPGPAGVACIPRPPANGRGTHRWRRVKRPWAQLQCRPWVKCLQKARASRSVSLRPWCSVTQRASTCARERSARPSCAESSSTQRCARGARAVRMLCVLRARCWQWQCQWHACAPRAGALVCPPSTRASRARRAPAGTCTPLCPPRWFRRRRTRPPSQHGPVFPLYTVLSSDR